MSSEFHVSDDVKKLIDDIILKNRWEPITDIQYYPGSAAGEGYACKHVVVDITTKNKSFRLFVKDALCMPNKKDDVLEKLYSNETYFYNVIYPAYTIFLEEKGIEKGFRYIPKCYGTSMQNVIALENLREKGFLLFDRNEAMNYKHISLVLKAFAKFHAVSYAFKDQERERYRELTAKVNQDFMGAQSKGKDSFLIRMTWDLIIDALSKLDPVTDKCILEKCNVNDLFNTVVDIDAYLNDYSVLTQGDCWCNNIMFLYEKEDKETPTDVVLIDWQLLRSASPIFDISLFFYSVANEEALSKLDIYLTEYYTELSDQIKILGSDSDRLYPFLVFEREWKSHCKYGFAMAFAFLRFMLVKEDEVPKLDGVDYENFKMADKIDYFPKFDNEVEYIRRIRVLCEFMVNKNYL